jgi:hypothetical protein
VATASTVLLILQRNALKSGAKAEEETEETVSEEETAETEE